MRLFGASDNDLALVIGCADGSLRVLRPSEERWQLTHVVKPHSGDPILKPEVIKSLFAGLEGNSSTVVLGSSFHRDS